MHYKHYLAKIEEVEALIDSQLNSVDKNLFTYKYMKVCLIVFAVISGLIASTSFSMFSTIVLSVSGVMLLGIEYKGFVERAYEKRLILIQSSEHLLQQKKQAKLDAQAGVLDSIEIVEQKIHDLRVIEVSVITKTSSL